MVFDDFAKYATALGTANALSIRACANKEEDFTNFIDKVNLVTLGKKMKIIDDSPTI